MTLYQELVLLTVCLWAATSALDPGGLYPECGSGNQTTPVDQSEPESPGPFHDLTARELRQLREFLERDPNIQAAKSSSAGVNSSYVFTAELFLAKKSEVLNFLDHNDSQPKRQARVIIFRGDVTPALVEEYVCGPLPDVTECRLLNLTSYRNPLEFTIRPMNGLEDKRIKEDLLKRVDKKVGFLLKESYGETFSQCQNKELCLASAVSPVGTGLSGDLGKRLMWVNAAYNLPYKTMHLLDFSVLVDTHSPDPDKWTVVKVWYSNRLFQSLDELVSAYNNGSIPKTKVKKPDNSDELYSSLKRRGDPMPPNPHRAPKLVEPDGKRYSVQNMQVTYMDWTFNYRLSALSGPALYDIRFKGERIVYELALSDIAVLYSGFAPFGQTSDYVDSGVMLGSRSKSLVPGADCPDTATFLQSVFLSQYNEEPATYPTSICLFENNNGRPLRQHLSYTVSSGAFYAGMLDSALTLRSSLAVHNYDYTIDFIFHQNGAIETRVMASGYLQASFFTPQERPYGHQIQDHIVGHLHHHLAHFKVDLDIGGTSNRYQTLRVSRETTSLTAFPEKPYSQTKVVRSVKTTEMEATSAFNISTFEYHLVYNEQVRNKYDEPKSYRIHVKSPSKNLLPQDSGNENTMTWARHQLAVTRRKDEEMTSSSVYGMFDSLRPAVNFSSFLADDEDIVDQDIVFWVSLGFQHIPHSEDIPVTTSVNQMSFFLLPHNYFPECPSVSSRDAIFIEHKDPRDPTKGVKVERNGYSRDQCVLTRPTLEEYLEADPDRVLESRRPNPTDF